MKGSRSVCLLCRHQLATAGKLRATQWQAQAALFSTTTPRADDTAEPAAGQSASNIFRRVSIEHSPREPRVKLSQAKPRKPPEKPSARVDALFQQIIQEQHEQHGQHGHHEQLKQRQGHGGQPEAPANGSTNVDLELVQAIGKLQAMVESDAPVADAFAYLKAEIYPTVQIPNINIPQVYFRVVSDLLDKVFEAKKADMHTDGLPTAADIFRVYVDIGELKPRRWANLVGKLVEIVACAQYPPELDLGKREAMRQAMLVDLVESWKVLSLPKIALTPTNGDKITDGFWFPRPDKFSLLKFSKKGNFPVAFSTVFPQYHPTELGAPVAVLAVATYALLLDGQPSSVNARRSAARFMSKVAYMITLVQYRDQTLRKDVAHWFKPLEEYVMTQWPIIKDHLKAQVESMDRSTRTAQQPSGSSSATHVPSTIPAASIGRRLAQAYGTRNDLEVDRLWQEFVGSEKDISAERAAELRQHPDLIDSFINTRMALNRPHKAIAAWGVLSKIGLKPTLRTWNVMLDGCKKAGNANFIKNIWAKLAASGTELDTAVWTTRVSGLIECGDLEAGIMALEEMTNLWKAASKDKKLTAVKPSIEPVNAALAGLIRQKQEAAAEKLLAWASRHGIEPDIFTFNTLLRPLIRDGNRDGDVHRLFSTMQTFGVRADAATFTVVLDAAYSKIDPQDSAAQTKVVQDVLASMKAAGLESNLQTYGKMIYLLLRSNARQAVELVVNQLWAEGHEFSPHIYTMLVEDYFARRPPNLKAVDDLVERRRLLDYDDMDRVFYDRVIKGYALVGRTDTALEMYYRLSDGVRVNLGTQADLVNKLIEQGRLEDARALVNRTKRRFEAENPGATEEHRFWSHHFWHQAARYGLIERSAPAGATGAASASGIDVSSEEDTSSFT
ncbi:Uu.00g060110.m01.CDS01 [Anthostomella pinea]|uniref:Uu.00g060110.m01.CDS01 n=1 Tax=Anthostomella pinea TaxID=933095 RepID=A0AAI8YK09_9PEZI|nr:Uu.00g060110.m01.CDS01 [Anthostomella pinea]